MIYSMHFIHSWRDRHLRIETEEKLFGLKNWLIFTVQFAHNKRPHLRFINRNYSSTRGEQTSNVALQQALTTKLIYRHSQYLFWHWHLHTETKNRKKTLNKTKTIHLVLHFFHPVLWIFEMLLFFLSFKMPAPLGILCLHESFALFSFVFLSLVMELQPVLHLLLPLHWFRTSFQGLCALSSSCRLIQMNDSKEMCL